MELRPIDTELLVIPPAGVRLIHKPTGLSAESTSEPNLWLNRIKAREELRVMLLPPVRQLGRPAGD